MRQMWCRRAVFTSRERPHLWSLSWREGGERRPPSGVFTLGCTTRLRPFASGEYRGPGGLTASEIFEKVQDSANRDAQFAKKIAENLQTESVEEQDDATQKNPKDMSVKELIEVPDRHSVDRDGCFEKEDLVKRVQTIAKASVYNKK